MAQRMHSLVLRHGYHFRLAVLADDRVQLCVAADFLLRQTGLDLWQTQAAPDDVLKTGWRNARKRLCVSARGPVAQ